MSDKTKARIRYIAENVEPTVCAIGILITVIAVCINVGADLLFGKRFTAAEEIASLGYIWVTFAGVGYLYRTDSFMEVSFVVKGMNHKVRYFAELFRIVYLSAFSYIIISATIKLLKNAFIKKMVSTKIPYFYLDLSILIGFSILFLLTIVDIVKWFIDFKDIMAGRKAIKGTEEAEEETK